MRRAVASALLLACGQVREVPTEAGVDAGACRAVRVPDGGTCSADGWCWTNPLPQGGNLNGVFASSPGDAWAVGIGGTILHWNGSAWSIGETGGATLRNGFATSTCDAWAVGDRGTILHWDGSTWTPAKSPTDQVLYGVYASSPDEAWAVGDHATILHF